MTKDGSLIFDTHLDNKDLEKELAKLRTKLKKAADDVGRQTEKVRSLEEQYKKLASGEVAPKALTEMEKTLAKNEAEYDKLIAKATEYEDKLRELRQIAGMETTAHGVASPQTQGQIDTLIEEYKQLDGQMAEAYEQSEKLRASIAQMRANPQNSAEIQKLNAEYQTATIKLESLKQKEQEAGVALREAMRPKLVDQTSTAMDGLKTSADRVASSVQRIENRVKRLVGRVMFFSVIAIGLNSLRRYMSSVLKTNNEFVRSLSNLKGALLTAFQPLIDVIIPALTSLINMLTTATSAVATFISALFGKTVKQSSAAAESLYSEAKALDATGEAAEGAGKTLANFDEINQLQRTEGVNGNGSSTPGVGFEAVATSDLTGVEDAGERIRTLFSDLNKISLDNLIASFGRLKEALSPFTQAFFAGLRWFWDNICVPFAGWVIEDLIPAFFDLLAAALDALNPILEAIMPLLLWLWKSFLQPIAQWTGTAIIFGLEALTLALNKVSDWMKEHPETVKAMTTTIVAFFAAWKLTTLTEFIINAGGIIGLLKILKNGIYAITIAKIADKVATLQIIALYIKDWAVALATSILNLGKSAAAIVAHTVAVTSGTIATTAAAVATTAWSVAMTVLTSPITLVVAAIGALIAIIVVLVQNWDTVKATAVGVWESIVAIWGNFTVWFTEKIVTPFKEGVKAVGNFFIDIINTLIGAAESFVNFFLSGINRIIDAINSISFDLPKIWGGEHIGFNLSTVELITLGRVPRLAAGAVIPPNREFLALLGDQKQGTNIEAPLETIVAACKQAMSEGSGSKSTVILELDRRELGRAVFELNRKETTRRGVRLAGV